MADSEKEGSRQVHLERNDVESAFEIDPPKDGSTTSVMGTVKLTEGTVVYIPTPTADPRGRNLPRYSKTKTWLTSRTRSSQLEEMAEDCSRNRYIHL